MLCSIGILQMWTRLTGTLWQWIITVLFLLGGIRTSNPGNLQQGQVPPGQQPEDSPVPKDIDERTPYACINPGIR